MNLGMNSASVMGANPPYIRFELRAVERRKPATEGGSTFYVDTDFALITSHGSKDTVEKVAPEWFEQLKEQVRQGRFPQQWLDAYKAAYSAWKNDQELPVVGTPIKNWPVATAGEVKSLAALGIRAVEDLANANEELISKLGMGGRSLCARAKDWVVSSQGTAPLVSQLDSMRQVNLGLEEQLRLLKATVATLISRLDQREASIADSIHSGAPVSGRALEDRLADARAAAESTGLSDSEAVDEALAEE